MSGRFNLNDYVTVDERIDKFWDAHRADGSIQTEVCWVADDGGSVAIRASVYLGPRLIATGIAQEERGTGGANRTSWWENAETSAIGRALANYGMSLSKQRPSREEMAKAERYEDDDGNAASQPPRAQNAAPTRSQPLSATEPPNDAPQALHVQPPARPSRSDDDYLAIVNDDTRIPERRVQAAKLFVAQAKDAAGVQERVLRLTSLPVEERDAIRDAALDYLRAKVER